MEELFVVSPSNMDSNEFRRFCFFSNFSQCFLALFQQVRVKVELFVQLSPVIHQSPSVKAVFMQNSDSRQDGVAVCFTPLLEFVLILQNLQFKPRILKLEIN